MHPPSIKETAFSCPHCGAYTTQHWHNGYVGYISKDPKIPIIPDSDVERSFKDLKDFDEEAKRPLIQYVKKMRSKLLFIDKHKEYTNQLNNLFLSRCYNCSKWAIWVNEDLVYPRIKSGAQPNQDLPEEALAVVEEARSIIDASPKGAAALLRLSIQMLCKHLGERGDNLNDDIANLVKKGLNPMVAKSLDIVRVIGNESVHPGSIDLNDDKDTATRLFDLINIITDQMITNPNNIEDLYSKLPESKRAAIEKRDE